MSEQHYTITPCTECSRAVFLAENAQEGPSKRFTWHFCLEGRHKPRWWHTEPSGRFLESMHRRGDQCPDFRRGSPREVDLPIGEPLVRP